LKWIRIFKIFIKIKLFFLTGGTGFLGKVLIEKILRATDVKRIYVLVRWKKGKDIHERIAEIFTDSLFEELLRQKSNAAQYITAISGDCALPNLGLSELDRDLLLENVDVVIHSAATVRFNEPISNALIVNVQATMDMIQLAQKMVKLKAFVYVSTAFSSCLQTHIEERVYAKEIGIGAEDACKVSGLLGKEVMNRISNELCHDFPNTYTYTKALAEEAVLTKGSGLPICIFRPGIVVPIHKEPIPGWVDNYYGPSGIIYGVGKGVLRVMYLNAKTNAILVPVDYCANLMLACAWNTAKTVQQSTNEQQAIYNFVPDDRNPIKWADYEQYLRLYGYKNPLNRMIWYPCMIATDKIFLYKLLCIFWHIIPGYIFDGILLFSGKKTRMVKLYRKIQTQTEALQYFVSKNWTFSIDSTTQLWESLSEKDQRLFDFDMSSIDWSLFFCNHVKGARRFLGKEDPSTLPVAMKRLKKFFILHCIVLCMAYGGSLTLMLWIFLKIINLW